MNIYLDGLPQSQRSWAQFNRRFPEWLRQRDAGIEITNFYEFNNQVELFNCFETILAMPETENNCTITLCCHGEMEGLKVNNEIDTIDWVDLREYIIELKDRFPNLIFILSVCNGASIGVFDEGEPFVFAYNFKIAFKPAMEAAALIISNYHNNIPLNQIQLNVMEFLTPVSLL